MSGTRRRSTVLCGLLVLVVGITYWPVRHAEFVWDDIILFHDVAALRHDDSWLTFLVNGFNGYVNYFRPLVATLFAVQLRLFDAQPGPMHLVSLAVHLFNTMLVWLLARRLRPDSSAPLLAACALIFGLHPALVESVVWISCQNELLVTATALLTLLANASIVSNTWRPVVVGLMFFAAACTKESAVAVPLLILLFDIFSRAVERRASWTDVLRSTWRHQRGVYVALLIAGALYITLRICALGVAVAPHPGNDALSIAHFQKVCFTLANYARLAVWPMSGLAPLHEMDQNYFRSFSWELIGQDFAALVLVIIGVICFLRRHPVGALILSFTIALIAVLNIIPIPFVESAYHERYLTLPLAVSAAWLAPAASDLLPRRKIMIWLFGLAALGWLILATVNVRATIPLWSDESALWQWATRVAPNSLIAQDHLLSMYLMREDYADARVLARQFIDKNVRCPNCMINVAFLALHDSDEPMAAEALKRIEASRMLASDRSLFHQYVLATGELRELRKDSVGAEDAYRDAIATDPDDPNATMQLAALLIAQGRFEEGQTLAQRALEQFAPDERERRRRVLEAITRDAKRTRQPPSKP